MNLRRFRAAPAAAILALLLALSPASLAAQARAAGSSLVVPSPLTAELLKLFPEMAQGYVDFTGNGKADQTSDLNENIPESRVRDAQLQAQEILDFLVQNWRFIPLDKLKAVQAAVRASSGALNELIAIDFAAALDEAVRQREAMGAGLYLTPSAYKDAMERLGAIIGSMSVAYKKEGAKAESDFVAARDSLFGMIEKGYPLPADIPSEERATLATAMVNTIQREGTSNPGRTRTAIKVLGQLKSSESAAWLLDLAAGEAYPTEAMRALGEIGFKPAIPVLAKQLKGSTDPAVRKAALEATGAIGGAEGLDTILELVKPQNRESLSPELLEATAQALAGIAQKGNTDLRIQTALRELAASERPAVRGIVARGLGAFASPQALETLIALLGADKDKGVRMAAVSSLARLRNDQIMPAFMKVLKERELDPELEVLTLKAVGESPQGTLAVSIVIEALADPREEVRAAASAALVRLYPANQALVAGGLTRVLLASADESLLVTGTALLATLADPGSLPTLLALLQKPQPEVKRNAAWALYRIRSASNVKVMEELQKLVTNENETIAVRINAVRALGAIGWDSPQANIWQTLVTTMQMRGEKYATLRLQAARALGSLGGGKPPVLSALARAATRDPDPALVREAILALRELATPAEEAEEALVQVFGLSTELELRLLALEVLADLGSPRSVELAQDLLAGEAASAPDLSQKRRIASALSQSPTELSASALLDAMRDPALVEFGQALLEGYPRELISGFVSRRLRTETDKALIGLLGSLEARLQE